MLHGSQDAVDVLPDDRILSVLLHQSYLLLEQPHVEVVDALNANQLCNLSENFTQVSLVVEVFVELIVFSRD